MTKAIARRTKRNYSNAEKKAIVNKFINSRLAKREFCKQENVSESALYRWHKELVNANETMPAFVPVQSSSKLTSDKDFLRLKLPNQIELLIPGTLDISYISQIIKGVIQ